MAEVSGAQGRLIDQATAAGGGPGSLSDIQHVVILMQENRSFDHYFGTMSGVRGYCDPEILSQFAGGRGYPIFDQFGYQPGKGADASGYLEPFRPSTWASATRCRAPTPCRPRRPAPNARRCPSTGRS